PPRCAVPRHRDPPHGIVADADGLGAERHGVWVGEREAAQSAVRLRARDERVAADEVALVELDRDAEPGFVRRVLRRDVGPPDAVALLEPQRVDRLVAAGYQALITSLGP